MNKQEQELWDACLSQNIQLVRSLLDYCDPNISDDTGDTLLHHVCDYGYTDIVRLLLSHNVSVNIINNNEQTPLYIACQQGHYEITELLLNDRANVTISDSDRVSPLHIAVINGHERVVKLLIKSGIDANIENRDGETPIFEACDYGHTNIVKILLESKADINICDANGIAPLYIAAEHHYDEIVRYLVEHHQQYGIIVNCTDTQGINILHYYNGNPEMQRFLFEHGVVPSGATDVNNLQNITHDAQSVHANPAVKQMRFYIHELKNAFSNQDIRELTNALNLSKELRQLFNFGANSKNIELLSLPKSEKEGLLKPIFDNTQDNKTKEHYHALLESNNADFAKEIISKSVVALDKWLERDAQGNYKHGKATATIQYDYSNDKHGKVTLPETLSMIRWLIDQNSILEEKREVFATFCDINKRLIQSNFSQIQTHYPKIKEEDFVNKASVHQLSSQLDDKEVSKLYNIVSNQDIEIVLKEHKLFTLAKGIYVASITYGEDREACFGGSMQQMVATVGEISPTIINKYAEYLEEENKRNANQVNIDSNNVLSVAEVMSGTLIEQVQDKPDVALMLSEATLRVKESLESISILDPNSITLEQQQLLSSVHKAFLSDIKKALPNYARDIPTREELALIVKSLDKSPKLQQWSLSYTVSKKAGIIYDESLSNQEAESGDLLFIPDEGSIQSKLLDTGKTTYSDEKQFALIYTEADINNLDVEQIPADGQLSFVEEVVECAGQDSNIIG